MENPQASGVGVSSRGLQEEQGRPYAVVAALLRSPGDPVLSVLSKGRRQDSEIAAEGRGTEAWVSGDRNKGNSEFVVFQFHRGRNI